ncbi:AMP-binding protein [Gordonia terrae]|uniref:AMP-binding protein n=1 Tax=Gordonia terrae TaxID=2055 RepID=UPI003F6C0341
MTIETADGQPSPGTTSNMWASATVSELTIRILARYPSRIAFSDHDGELTYAAAADLIGRFQRVLSVRGFRRGDRIALLSGNRAEAWCASIAVLASGMVASWLHPMGSLDDHLFQLDDLDAVACLVDTRRHCERAAQLAEFAAGTTVWGIGPSDEVPDLLAEALAVGASRPHDDACSDEIAMINYTGGTTGRPKGAVRRHGKYAYQALLGTATDFEIPFEAQYLVVAPMTHVAGTKILPVLSRGGTVYFEDRFDADRVLEVMARNHISMTLMVPTMIYGLLDHPDLERTDLSALELLLYGASPMSGARLDEGIERLGPIFGQLYGQTECYPISILRRNDHLDQSLRGSCGVPVSTVQSAILDIDGNRMSPGASGELCVRGPGVMDEYWRQPDQTAEAFANGWLHTGDIVRADDRGYMTIVDRIKDMIISGGFNIFPREIEDVLARHEAVSAAAVFGTSDERWGEAVTAAVVLRPEATATVEDLLNHVRASKGSLHTPKNLRIVDSLPSTGVGKIDKKLLSATWSSRF